tara:strand:- start:3 stop:422 length:420 start_codon:yes stop_codon:yes gene_type:complete
LVIGHAAIYEFKQIIIAAADPVVFNDLRKFRDTSFENFKILASAARDVDFGENLDRIRQAADVDPGAVSRNKTRRFQSFDPLQAGALRQSHRICQCRISNATVLLEFLKNFEVDAVQFRRRRHFTDNPFAIAFPASSSA